MAFSKYYTEYKPPQQQGADFTGLLRKLEEQRQAQQQQQQQNMSPQNMQNIGKLGKSIFGSGGGMPESGGQSFGGGNSVYGGIDIPTSSASSLDMPASTASSSSGTPWYSGFTDMFSGGAGGAGGGEGAGQAAMMNPAVAIPTAVLLSANVAHNKGISPWNETLKGQMPGNLADYYGEGNHGFMSKVLDKDGTVGQTFKGFTDFSTLDPKNALKNTFGGVKSAFKGKLFG